MYVKKQCKVNQMKNKGKEYERIEQNRIEQNGKSKNRHKWDKVEKNSIV